MPTKEVPMKPGKELDTRIALEVFGDGRPPRNYSTDMGWAWEVAEKMKISLIPIAEGGLWFAFIGNAGQSGWESPQALLAKLESGDFTECGAALGTEAPFVICQAAINALEKRKHEGEPTVSDDEPLAPIPPELLN